MSDLQRVVGTETLERAIREFGLSVEDATAVLSPLVPHLAKVSEWLREALIDEMHNGTGDDVYEATRALMNGWALEGDDLKRARRILRSPGYQAWLLRCWARSKGRIIKGEVLE
jgi:hypothetical protein